MRKFLALLFGLALFVPLAACGGGDDEDSSSGSSSGSASSTEDEDEDTTTTTEDEGDDGGGDSDEFCGVIEDINDANFDDLDFEDPEAVAAALSALNELQDAAPNDDVADDLDLLISGFEFLAENFDDLNDPEAAADLEEQFADEFEDFDAAGERVDEFSLDECGITVDGETADDSGDEGDDDATDDTVSDSGTDEEAGDPDEPPSIDDPELEQLAEDCFDGSGSACDQLFFAADVDSPEEDYGDTCGGRFDSSPGLCATAIGD